MLEAALETSLVALNEVILMGFRLNVRALASSQPFIRITNLKLLSDLRQQLEVSPLSGLSSGNLAIMH